MNHDASRMNTLTPAMKSSRPYLLRALYDWILDNGLTPHLLVNAAVSDVQVPMQHVKDSRIVLNIAPYSIQGLQLGNEHIEFSARFGGVAMGIVVPVSAVLAIYAVENGQGMVFNAEENTPPPDSAPPETPSAGKPKLKLVT